MMMEGTAAVAAIEGTVAVTATVTVTVEGRGVIETVTIGIATGIVTGIVTGTWTVILAEEEIVNVNATVIMAGAGMTTATGAIAISVTGIPVVEAARVSGTGPGIISTTTL